MWWRSIRNSILKLFQCIIDYSAFLKLKISNEDFKNEFDKNGINKNWLKNLKKKTDKNGNLCRKR